MQRILGSILLVAVLAVVMVAPAAGQAPGPGTWNVGFTLQNLSADQATVHIDFIKADGTSGGTWDGTIAGNGSQFLYSGSIAGLQANSETAATISSSTQLAAVANLASSSPKTEAAYSGIDSAEVSPVLFAPGVYKNYYSNTSNVRVQNTGASKTCARVSFFAMGSSSAIDTDVFDIPIGAGHTFTQADNAALPDGFIGSAKIESLGAGTAGCGADTVAGQGLAAIVNIVVAPGPSVGNPSTLGLFGSYNAIINGGSVAYAPVLANKYYNNNSSLTILNLRNAAQWVRVTYGDGSVKEKQLGANSSQLWYTPNEGPAVGWFGGGKAVCITGQGGSVTTDCEIVGTVNQINTAGGFASYNGFKSGAGTVRLPIVNRLYATTYGGYTTSVTCQNIGGVATDVALTLTGGMTVPSVTGVAPNGTAFWYLNKATYTGVTPGFNGSATATASAAGAQIVCIGQQNGETPPTAGDWLTTYNGINQ
jgi:hypothetical protein